MAVSAMDLPGIDRGMVGPRSGVRRYALVWCPQVANREILTAYLLTPPPGTSTQPRPETANTRQPTTVWEADPA